MIAPNSTAVVNEVITPEVVVRSLDLPEEPEHVSFTVRIDTPDVLIETIIEGNLRLKEGDIITIGAIVECRYAPMKSIVNVILYIDKFL